MNDPALELNSISKLIDGVSILQDINLTLNKGEFCVLLGENGAGKSSLVKILSGIYRKDSGSISVDGHIVDISSPAASAACGIFSLQQESMIYGHLTVTENIFINNAPVSFLKIRNKREANIIAQKLLDDLGFPLKSTQKAEHLDLAQKRMVEIARLVSTENMRILILDEPLASIGEAEGRSLFRFLKEFKKHGGSIIYVTQNFKDVYEHADRVVIIRDGKLVDSIAVENVTSEKIEKMVWGQYYPDKYPKLNIPIGKEIFCVEGLSTENLLQNISFSLFQGEILGITGLVGSGRSQLAKTLFGLHPITSGTFYIDRLKTKINSPIDAIKLGMAYVTEDRSRDGLFFNLNTMHNVFVLDDVFNKSFMLKDKYETALYDKYINKLNMNINSNKNNLYGLSGGTHQKLLLLRWFFSYAKIFIMDEPTHGVDIASKVDIYNLMNDLIRKKSAIILISSSFDELVGMCDRILVLKDGMISFEAHRKNLNEFNRLYQYAIKIK